MNQIFYNSPPADRFEKPRQEKEEKNGFVLIHFEHSEIDKIRKISESGYFPIVKRTKMELVVLSKVPLS